MVTISSADLLPPPLSAERWPGWSRTTRTSRTARTSSRLSASSAPFEAYLPFVGGRPGSAEDKLKLESKFRLKISHEIVAWCFPTGAPRASKRRSMAADEKGADARPAKRSRKPRTRSASTTTRTRTSASPTRGSFLEFLRLSTYH